jgi:TrmH family RNA methyltransferase
MDKDSVDRSSEAAVVLCRVTESGNVGSVCRAMKTMGFAKLVLADCPEYDEIRVRTMAVHAADVFESAQRYPDLGSALSAYSLTAGFTRRSGAKRKQAAISARDFARAAAGLPVPGPLFVQRNQLIAMVFGNERDGLSDAELALCTLGVYIPSSDEFPSLNVAQAVQIACYEFFASRIEAESALPERGIPGGSRALSRIDIENGVEEIVKAFAVRGTFKQSDDSFLRGYLRDLCERAGVMRSEMKYLEKIFLKALALGSKE